jgi:hypothetical protein
MSDEEIGPGPPPANVPPPDEFLTQIGRVTINFTALEFAIDIGLALLLSLHPKPAAQITTQFRNFPHKMEFLRELGRVRLSTENFRHLDAVLIPKLSSANGKRSKNVVHAILAVVAPPGQEPFFQSVSRGEFFEDTQGRPRATPALFEAIANEIRTTHDEFLDFAMTRIISDVGTPPWLSQRAPPN